MRGVDEVLLVRIVMPVLLLFALWDRACRSGWMTGWACS